MLDPSEYDPKEHGMGPKFEFGQNDPAGQLVQLVAFPTEYVPAGHIDKVDVFVDGHLYPAGQDKHDMLFALLYVPGGHETGFWLVDGQALPAGQEKQIEPPVLYLPAGQAVIPTAGLSTSYPGGALIQEVA